VLRNTVLTSEHCDGNVAQKFTFHKLFKLQNSDTVYYGTTNVCVWNSISMATPGLTGLTFTHLQHVFKFQHMVYEKHEYYLK
jgi:hypothetical protein